MTSRYPKICLWVFFLLLGTFFAYNKAKAVNPCSVSLVNTGSVNENSSCINSPAVPAPEFAANVAGSWSVSGAASGGVGQVVSCILDPASIGSNCVVVGTYSNIGNAGPLGFGLGCLNFDCTYADLTITSRNTVSLTADQDIQIVCKDPAATNYLGIGFCTYPTTGTIQVQSEFAMTANITGPNNYDVSAPAGYGAVFPAGNPGTAPVGTYTIRSISSPPCQAPTVRSPGATQTLSAGGVIFFIVDYNDTCGPPATGDIMANGSNGPVSISYNTPVTLSWTSNNASSCNITSSPNVGSWSGTSNGGVGTANLTASSYTFSISCSGPGGTGASDSVVVNISPPTPDIKANGLGGTVPVNYGSSVNITWTSTNAASCTTSPNIGSGTSGSAVVIPTADITYTLTCTGAGTVTDTVTLDIPPAPTAILTCNL